MYCGVIGYEYNDQEEYVSGCNVSLTIFISNRVRITIGYVCIYLVTYLFMCFVSCVVPEHPRGSRSFRLRAEGAGGDGAHGLEVGVPGGGVGRQSPTWRRPPDGVAAAACRQLRVR